MIKILLVLNLRGEFLSTSFLVASRSYLSSDDLNFIFLMILTLFSQKTLTIHFPFFPAYLNLGLRTRISTISNILHWLERARNDTNDQCYEFGVIKVIPSSFGSTQNDGNRWNTSPRLKTILCPPKLSLLFKKK